MKNIYAGIPEELPEELIEPLLETGKLTIERIVSRGHTSPEDGWYDQDRNEWLVLLSGNATILFADGTETRLSPGDTLHIPAHRKHRVTRTAPDTETLWLAVHYP
ncbi:MAG TPA: cupin domain-containing protein [Gammaproteobacteria bacterium]|nr:cupin domain-containing protein [Gammaproteobacteria bacterium]